MNVFVFLDMRFHMAEDGSVWTYTSFPYSFWTRYLDVFDEVIVVARIRSKSDAQRDFKRCDGPDVSFIAIPDYHGPLQYSTRYYQIAKRLKNIDISGHAVILRVPSQVGNLMERRLRKNSYPFGLEVVGDPYDAFAPGVIIHPFRPLFRWIFRKYLYKQCANACSISYVCKYLQRRWRPSNISTFITSYSSIELPDDAFARAPRRFGRRTNGWRLINIGSMEQMYKGHEMLLRALRIYLDHGNSLQLYLIGDGKLKLKFETLVLKLGLNKHVYFLGTIPSGVQIYNELDKADLFVLPSKTEGLPRSLIEAMARALPCIGTKLGGIPELLTPQDIIESSNPNALARKIYEVLNDPELMTQMSARNLEKAKEYREEALRQKRVAFYRELEQRTLAYVDKRKMTSNQALV